MYALIQALSVSARAPMLEQVTLLQGPYVALPSAMGVQTEPDRRWRDFLNSWTDYNTGTRQVGAWMRQSLLAMGVKAGEHTGECRPLSCVIAVWIQFQANSALPAHRISAPLIRDSHDPVVNVRCAIIVRHSSIKIALTIIKRTKPASSPAGAI